LLSNKTARMGDKAKPLVSWAGGFAVCEGRAPPFEASANQDIDFTRRFADAFTSRRPAGASVS
jgi:hypothetical protein